MSTKLGEPLQGRCLSMCPPSEMRLRQRERMVHLLECRPIQPRSGAPRTEQKKVAPLQGDPQCFVKEFARSSAGREIQVSEVRPLPVLARTLRYLLTDVYSRSDCSRSCVHKFLSDRLRSVRQDLAVQGLLSSARAAPLLAVLVRYYALQQYRMCEEQLSDFDPFLNMKHLQEVLAGLVRLYQEQPEHCSEKREQFTFDYEEDEDEFFITKDSGLCSDESVRDSTRSPNCVDSDSSSTSTPHVDHAAMSSAESVVTRRFGEESAEVAGVLERISGLDLTADTEPISVSCAPPMLQDYGKEEKNRQNMAMGEMIRETSPTVPYTDSTVAKTDNHLLEIDGNASSSCNSQLSDQIKQTCEREEMECLHLLLNYDNSEAVQHTLELPDSIRSSPLLSKVLDAVLKYHSCGRFVSVLRLLPLLPPVLCCCLYLSLPKLQKKALQVLSIGYSSSNTRYALAELRTLLVLPSELAAKQMCLHYGLTVTESDHVAFKKCDFKLDAPVMSLERTEWLDQHINSVPPQELLLPYSLPMH